MSICDLLFVVSEEEDSLVHGVVKDGVLEGVIHSQGYVDVGLHIIANSVYYAHITVKYAYAALSL